MTVLPELRIAVAMRGGVSLAVWMGGACSEIDALRRARPEDPTASLYAQLLRATGYGSVAVDAVAGGLSPTMWWAFEGILDVSRWPRLQRRIQYLWSG